MSWFLIALFSWMSFWWFVILVIFAQDTGSELVSTCFLVSWNQMFCVYFILIIYFSFFQMLHALESAEWFYLQFVHKRRLLQSNSSWSDSNSDICDIYGDEECIALPCLSLVHCIFISFSRIDSLNFKMYVFVFIRVLFPCISIHFTSAIPCFFFKVSSFWISPSEQSNSSGIFITPLEESKNWSG